MTTVVETPALAGSRRRAQQALQGLPPDLDGAEVNLVCRGLLAAAVSFVDEIVIGVLVQRNAKRLVVTGATDHEFIGYLKSRAEAHHVEDRLYFDS